MAVRSGGIELQSGIMKLVLSEVAALRGSAEPAQISIASGSAGVAYFLYRHAEMTQSAGALDAAWERVAAALPRLDDPRAYVDSSKIGPLSLANHAPGVASVAALIANELGRRADTQTVLRRFLRAEEYVDFEADSVTNGEQLDLVLGVAGLVAAACGLSAKLDSEHRPLLQAFADRNYSRLLQSISRDVSMRSDATFAYLGLAHGWAGILYAMLSYCLTFAAPPPAVVEARLDELAAERYETAHGPRWRMFACDSDARDGQSSWCHGNAGYVQLWLLAAQAFPRRGGYMQLAESAASELLRSPWSRLDHLCCGLAGVAHALLALGKRTSDRFWTNEAERVLEAAAYLHLTSPERKFFFGYGRLGIALVADELAHERLLA